MIKAVIFDIDGVLLDSFEANLKFFQDLMVKSGYFPPTREEFPPIFHLNMWDAIKALTKSDSENEIKKVWEAGRDRAVDYPVELLKMPEGAEGIVRVLSKSYDLAIVTNRIRNSIYEAPALEKLKEHFRVVVAYEDTVNHKPDPEPLLLAVKRLGIRPEEAIYIGDVENDVKAAKAAGMKVIVYSQDKIPGADVHTSSFKELPQVIASL